MKRIVHALPWLGFTALVAVFFYQVLLRGMLPVPADALVGLYHPWRDMYAQTNPRGVPFKNFLITDPIRQQIPWRKNVIDEWKNGRLPAWNPYAFSGTSLSGNIQAAIWYPFNILFVLLPFVTAWSLLIIIQPLLAGMWMMLYLKNRRMSAAAAFVGAVAFAFSGFAVSWMSWGTMVHVMLWVPLALLAVDRWKAKESLWQWVLSATVVFMITAGHVQIALYCLLLVCGYAWWHKRGALLAKAFPVGLLLSLPVWWPVVRTALGAGRLVEATWKNAEGWFIPIHHLAQFIAPDFFGNPATLNYWGTWNYAEMVGYIGIAPLLFAFLGLLRFADRWVKFWVGAGIVALLFSLATPVATLPFVLNLPVISALQPTRLLVIVVTALAMLAASGFDDWQRIKKSRMSFALLLLGSLLGALWLVVLSGKSLWPEMIEQLAVAKRNLILPSGFFAVAAFIILMRRFLPRLSGIAIVALLLLSSFDLLRFGWKFTPFTPREYFFPETQIISFLQAQPKPFRVMTTDDRILPPNVAGYFGIESIEGYDPLYSLLYEHLLVAAQRGKADIAPPYGFNRILTMRNLASPLLPLLNVRYVLSLDRIP